MNLLSTGDGSRAEIPTPAIATIELTRRFEDYVAVDHVNLSISQNSIWGLLGRNGAGKSTLIKMLTTLLPPTSGRALIAGFDILRESLEVRKRIGYVSQMLSADGELTGYENLLVSAKLYGLSRNERVQRIAEALEFMELTTAKDKLVRHYSGGMIRRLEIAQSMLHRPVVLFLDEPTVGLDPTAKHSVWERIHSVQARFGMTVLLTTHDMEEAEQLCDKVAFMHSGRVVISGSPKELKEAVGPKAQLDDVFVYYTGLALTERGDIRDVAQTRLTTRRLQ